MYIVLVYNKTKEVLSDLVPELNAKFPGIAFTIEGSEEKGFKLRLEGEADEKAPRNFAEKYMKTWKPKPPEPEEPLPQP